MALSTTKILGYADRLSVAPGERIEFKLSCTQVEHYRLDFVRILCGDPDPRGPGLRLEQARSPVDGTYDGRFQPIDAGSYVRIDGEFGLDEGASFTLAAYVWPTAPGLGRQTVMGWWSEPERRGFAVQIDDAGRLRLLLGTDEAESILALDQALLERQWYFVTASYEANSRTAHISQKCLAEYPGTTGESSARQSNVRWRAPATQTPFMIAAHCDSPAGGRWMSGACYNGKVELPIVLGAALGSERVRTLMADPNVANAADNLLAAWDFSERIPSATVIDRSPRRAHGRTVNLPARGVTGHRWDGSTGDWRVAPSHYGAIHFHDDDLHDCGWSSDFALTVPADWSSGFYAARLRAPEAEGYVAFFVRPPRNAAGAPIALVAATATYMSYANTHIK
ncbi:MAG: N,N-dimethylformamidase beta subunit family domain-containing protein, partial [Gammaproteobacteria bacterium]